MKPNQKFPLCSKHELRRLMAQLYNTFAREMIIDNERNKEELKDYQKKLMIKLRENTELALSKAEGIRQMNCEACQHDMFRLGEKSGIKQGKLDQSFLSTDKNLGKNEMTALIDILENAWEELKKKNPKIAREMLTHYVEMWNIPVRGYDNTAVIEMIWDGRLSNINANGFWFDNYEKQKSYYVASRLKSQLSKSSEKEGAK